MFDSPEELLNHIALGEDSLLEFKEVRTTGGRVTEPRRDALADELAAFANSSGGVLLLGVHDTTRDILGIPTESLDAVETFVRELVNDSIKPPLAPLILKVSLPDALGNEKAILKVEVTRSLFVHKSPGGYWHRVGSSKREMPPDYLARLFQQRSQSRLVRFDETPVPETGLDDLAEPLWGRFKTSLSDEEPERFLQKVGMATLDGSGKLVPSVAGLLMASEDPSRWIRSAFIQAVSYAGDTVVPSDGSSTYQLDARDIRGPLDAQVEGALDFVARNMRRLATKEAGRTDIPQYDLTVVLEAIVNAVAHRDYSIYGAKIRLHMFSDRLEIYSPGALPNTMDVESMRLRQSSRNEVLTSLLARTPVAPREGLVTPRSALMDKRGEGVPIIMARGRLLSGRDPVYQVIGEELRLIVFGASE